MTESPRPYGASARGVTASDVERAADVLLRAGVRPTIEKVRAQLRTGSPNTINPLLDDWWKKLSSRLDAGPAALHRLPESVAQIAEALWLQALDEGRRRAAQEIQGAQRTLTQDQQQSEVRAHVLSLREGELDSRLRERDRIVTALEEQLRDLTLLLRKVEATRDAQARRILTLEGQLLAHTQLQNEPATPQTARQRQVATRPIADRSMNSTTTAATRSALAKSRRR